MGADAERIFSSFNLTAAQEKVYATVLQKFDDYFIPKKNPIHARAVFHERKQESGESSELYYRTLLELAEQCEFTDKEERIRDQLVIGILDREVRYR